MSRLVVLLVVFAGVIALPESAAPQGQHARSCSEPFNLSLDRPETPHLPLPVVVHYMVQTGSRNDVSKKLPPAALEQIFRDTSRLTLIWRHAEIRPYLHRVERCSFSSRAFGIPANAAEDLPNPDRTDAGKELFQKINRAYNAPDVAGLDLFIWWGIQGVAGYADPHRDSGSRRTGAVWIDKDCLGSQNCDLLVAHEIGHFLGLCHACTIGSPVPQVPCSRCLPETMQRPDGTFTLANCKQVRGPRLMRNDNLLLFKSHKVTDDGQELSPCERELAKTFAEQRIGKR